MPFPAPSVSVPSLQPFQLYFNGVTMGPNQPIEFQKIEGLDRPDVRSGDVDQPRTSGQFIGLDLLSGRDIILSAEIAAANGVSLTSAVQGLRNALAPRGVIEDPLFVNVSGTTYAVTARVRKDNVPIDIAYANGGGLATNVVIQFHATDANIYSTPTSTATIGLPSPAGGFIFPLSFPLSFGGGGTGNTIAASNLGDVTCYPNFVVTGPCTYPAISNLTTGQTIAFNISLFAGDTLTIDMSNPHLATYTANGSTVGSSALYARSQTSSWWGLPPGVGPNAFNSGNSTISFNSQDLTAVAATLTMNWCSAFSSAT